MTTQMKTVLRALGADPKPLAEIARGARVSEEEASNALEQLTAHSLAIADDGGYELTGPLSWFGSFDGAVRYFVRRRKFIVTVPGDPHAHLYVDDVRIKGRHKAGDPDNETVAVLACGRTSLDVTPAFEQDGPDCEECRSALG